MPDDAMDLDGFDFDLPEELIALRPARPRSAARLLLAEGPRTAHHHVRDLPGLLRPGDLLVFNDTKVIPARLDGTRQRPSAHGEGVARIEVTLTEPVGGPCWRALARPARRLAPGDVIRFGGLSAAVEAPPVEGAVLLRFDRSGPALDQAIAETGAMPLPPYIARRRAADSADRDDYQTVFARAPGAVAAPTAALHFDAPLLGALDAAGIERAIVTLHVGAGTFLPVKDPASHRMHAEWGEVTAAAADAVRAARRDGRRVIAVGTTALRVLESAAAADGTVAPWSGMTDIFIRPGHRFRAIDGLMTNFHLPRSTLFMLVAALMGTDRMREIYAEAIRERYRFYSYGDSSLLLP